MLNEYKLPCNSGRMGFILTIECLYAMEEPRRQEDAAEVLESHSAITRYYRIGKLLHEISLDFGLSSVLHVYLDRESQHRLMSCMRMKTCMKMMTV